MVKKVKKKKKEDEDKHKRQQKNTSPWPRLEPTTPVSRVERFIQLTTAPSISGNFGIFPESLNICVIFQIYSGELLLRPVRGPDLGVAPHLAPGGHDAGLSPDRRRWNRTSQLVGVDDDDAGEPRDDDVAWTSTSCEWSQFKEVTF